MHQPGGGGVQPPPDRVGVAAFIEQIENLPQVGADQAQQRPAAELVVDPAQLAHDVVETVDDRDRQR
ncbi:MAG: hypothetical protein ACRDTF_18535 [Pseudonocardiaceae bacterium]